MDFSDFLNNNSTGIASLIGKLLGQSGQKSPYDVAYNELGKIPGQVEQYMSPYMDAGKNALPTLQNQYSNLLNNPGGAINQIGQAYQQSPGLDFQMKQALAAQQNAAAAGGMAGSPQHELQSMTIANNLANQDFNTWLSNALGMYSKGLGGEEDLYKTGYGASKDFSDTVGNTAMSQALMKMMEQKDKNEESGSIWGDIGNLASKALPLLAGFI